MRLFFGALIIIFVTWFGYQTFNYFFSNVIPIISISGIDNNGYYCGDVPCSIDGEHPYKIKYVSVLLDGKPLIYNFKIDKKSFQHPFTVNTRMFTNGSHQLIVRAVDGTFKKLSSERVYDFFVDNVLLQVSLVQQSNEYRVFQGRTLHVQFQSNKILKNACIHAFSQKFDCFQESKNSLIYECFIPIDCEEKPNEYLISIDCSDCVGTSVTLEAKVQVILFPFKKQKLSHIDPAKLSLEKEIGISQQQFESDCAALVIQSPHIKLWNGAFCAPLDVINITTDFGVMRISNERGRYMHKAVDLVAAPKSIVWAPQDGIVVMKNRYAYSGNTVIIDHGWGIFTLLFHLDNFVDDLVVGERIKKWGLIGTLGKTGYATGYHLHWEMRINNIPVDPLQWIKSDF